MSSTTFIVLLAVIAVVVWFMTRANKGRSQASQLDDAKAEARRWVERLGGQVMNLTGTNTASSQAIADASERYTAAGSQMDQAQTVEQCRLVTKTAMEGLYYIRAARTAMGIDPGPELPVDPDARRAGVVTEDRHVSVEGHDYEASTGPSDRTPHYYPGGRVAGRSVPQGWYSEPWWRPALVAGAWGIGSMLLFSAMFSGMAGIGSAAAWEQGYDAGQADGDSGDGGDSGGDSGDGGDFGGEGAGDFGGDGGGDFGGGDFGGGDFGGGDFGGFDF